MPRAWECLSINAEQKGKTEPLMLNMFYFQLQDSMVALLNADYFRQLLHSKFNQYSEMNGSPIKNQFVHYKN